MTASIRHVEKARVAQLPPGFTGDANSRAIYDDNKNPLHLHVHELLRGAQLLAAPGGTDCVIYVWKGAVRVGVQRLAAGSSLVVEHGASVEIIGLDAVSQLLTFFAAQLGATPRAGGHVHLLPTERVPRSCLSGTDGVGGGMHADASCPSCEVWLHENSFDAPQEESTLEVQDRGIHSHSEDEIIFVTAGHIRLGKQVCGPGTALAIGAHTFYSFGRGSDGLKFVNFRPRLPSMIKLKSGGEMDEVAFWRDRVGSPRYLAPELDSLSRTPAPGV
jgi:hypothetical protein